MTLRPYQSDALHRWERSTARRVLVVLPTGTGKTNVAVAAIRRAIERGKRVAFIAHRKELIDQAYARLTSNGVPPSLVGIVRGNEQDYAGCPVQVASVQTLARRGVSAAFDLLVIDEAHRTLAKSYVAVLDACPTARVMGLTATPCRLDGRGLGDVYEEIVEGPPSADLIEQGHLARARVFVPDTAVDTRGVARSHGDFDRGELAQRAGRRELVGNIVAEWKKHANGARTIAFGVNVAHAESIARRFREAGVSAAAVSGQTPSAKRDKLIARFRSGELTVLVNADLFIEGFDVPEARCAILARPTASLTIHLQQCGRVLRPGPERPVILDHAGNMRRHGHPEMPRTWSLTQTVERVVGVGVVRECDCGASVPAATTICPECGALLREPVRSTPEESEWGTLVEIAVAHGINANALRGRLNKGWTKADAVSKPIRDVRWHRWRDVAEANGVSLELFANRCSTKNGWDPERAATTQPRDSAWAKWRSVCEAHGVSQAAFYGRIKSGMAPNDAATAGARESSFVAVTVGGVAYKSVTIAARVLGVSNRTIYARIAEEKGLCKSCLKVPRRAGITKCSACNEAQLASERRRRVS